MKPQGLSVASVSWLFLEQQVGWGARGVFWCHFVDSYSSLVFFGWLGKGIKRWIFEDGRCCEETLVLCFFLWFVDG